VLGAVRHRQEARRFLDGFEDVVVAGGGQLDELWGGPFGHPYVLWQWASLARRAGARYLMLSVGVGKLGSRLSRLFAARALGMADYRSFRDEGSLRLAPFVDAGGGRVVPDLAYAVPTPDGPRDAGAARGGRPRLAVGPIAYRDPRVWPEKDAGLYEDHVRSTAELCRSVLALGWEIVFVSSDGPDVDTVRDVRAALEPHVTSEQRSRIASPETSTLDALLAALAGVDLVVAARLHCVLLAHVLGRPVLALSYERKVAALMEGMEQRELCFSIDGLDVPAAVARLQDMRARQSELERAVRAKVAGYRRAVEGQYDEVFGTRARADLRDDGMTA
jgi:polysaccharide pyruvyl transferase WcaK-like protein